MKKIITLSLTCILLVIFGVALIFTLYNKKIIKPPFSYTGNATFNNNTLTITESGTYTLSGYLENGLIHVNAKKADVILELDDLEIANTDQACIYVQKANSVTIVLSDGSTNVLTSGDETLWTDLDPISERKSESEMWGGNQKSNKDIPRHNSNSELSNADNDDRPPFPPDMFEDENDNDDSSDEEDLKDEEKAVIYCKDDLTIDGSGTLIINGYIKNGIQCADNLIVDNGCFYIKALGTGILGRDSLTINGGSMNISSHKDALKSTNDDEDKGWVVINDGDITLASAKNGVHAESSLTINGGKIDVVQSYEGLEGRFITINDGTVDIVSSDDGINAYGGSSNFGGPGGFDRHDNPDWENRPDGQSRPNGQMNTDKQSNSDGSDKPDRQLPPDRQDAQERPDKPFGPGMGGRNNIDNKTTLPINKSEVSATYESREDSEGNPLSYLVINGGTITVDAQGDGLDSNGDLVIYGGSIIVQGPSNNGNGALDSGTESGGKLLIHGGTIIAIGASGMAETFEEGSSQAAIRNIDNEFKTGDIITIKNTAGNELTSLTAKTSGNCIVFSHPDLNTDQNIIITVQ